MLLVVEHETVRNRRHLSADAASLRRFKKV